MQRLALALLVALLLVGLLYALAGLMRALAGTAPGVNAGNAMQKIAFVLLVLLMFYVSASGGA